jgi:hypothetical protein
MVRETGFAASLAQAIRSKHVPISRRKHFACDTIKECKILFHLKVLAHYSIIVLTDMTGRI